jgi:hypothetical protein
MPEWLKQAGFLAACLVIPIAWGWLVNWLFGHWRRRRRFTSKEEAALTDTPVEETEFIDYSI